MKPLGNMNLILMIQNLLHFNVIEWNKSSESNFTNVKKYRVRFSNKFKWCSCPLYHATSKFCKHINEVKKFIIKYGPSITVQTWVMSRDEFKKRYSNESESMITDSDSHPHS